MQRERRGSLQLCPSRKRIGQDLLEGWGQNGTKGSGGMCGEMGDDWKRAVQEAHGSGTLSLWGVEREDESAGLFLDVIQDMEM